MVTISLSIVLLSIVCLILFPGSSFVLFLSDLSNLYFKFVMYDSVWIITHHVLNKMVTESLGTETNNFKPLIQLPLKRAKMMINIDLDTPSDNFSCTFKCFRAVKLYKPVCWSDCVIVGFDQDGEYLLNSQSSLRRRMWSAQKFYSIFNLLYLSTFKLQ